jgi:hypothetical protein
MCKNQTQLWNDRNYCHIKNYVDAQLGGYADGSVREKYIWLRKEEVLQIEI